MRPNQSQEGPTCLAASEGRAAILTGGCMCTAPLPGGQRGSPRLHLQDSDSDQPQLECGPRASSPHPPPPASTVHRLRCSQKLTAKTKRTTRCQGRVKTKVLPSGLTCCDAERAASSPGKPHLRPQLGGTGVEERGFWHLATWVPVPHPEWTRDAHLCLHVCTQEGNPRSV